MEDLERVNFWKDKSVFVTGASGVVGSWLVKELLRLEAEVSVLIRDSTPRSELMLSKDIDRVNVVRGDLCSFDDILRTLNEYAVDTIFHLGAQAIVGTAQRNPISTFESNIKGTWNVLEAARLVGTVERVIVASTDKAYGDHEELPYHEDFSLLALHPYDASKACADILARTYAHSYDLPVAITRCGNIYGGGDLNFNRIVPGTIKSLLNGQRPVIRSDGSPLRDYVFVKDIVNAYLSVAEQIHRNEVRGEVFNFAWNRPFSVLDIVKKIVDLMGSELTPEVQNIAKNEIKNQYLDYSKANRILGWTPSFSIEQGLKETIDWYARHLKEEKK